MNLFLFDKNGREIVEGSFIRLISKNTGVVFYFRVSIKDGQLLPFKRFAYTSFEVIDNIPSDAIPSTPGNPEYWRDPFHSKENHSDKWFRDQWSFFKNQENKFAIICGDNEKVICVTAAKKCSCEAGCKKCEFTGNIAAEFRTVSA